MYLGGRGTKPSVPASPAERRCYPSDTSGGRPLTEAMVSYLECASAVLAMYIVSSETGKRGRHHNRLRGLFPTWPVIPPRRDDLATPVQWITPYAGDTAYADRAALWKEDGAARCHSDSRIIAHHGTTQGE